MSRASDDAADLLHLLTFEGIAADIKRYREAGEAVPPALYAQALKALKDNGIDSPDRAKKLHDRLAGRLPDLSEVEAAHEEARH